MSEPANPTRLMKKRNAALLAEVRAWRKTFEIKKILLKRGEQGFFYSCMPKSTNGYNHLGEAIEATDKTLSVNMKPSEVKP